MKLSARSVRMGRKKMPLQFVQCSLYFCESCQRAHKRPRTTTANEFVSVEKALKGKMKTSLVHCEKHPQQETNTYCHTDRQAICAECILDHKGQIDQGVAGIQGGNYTTH